MTVRRWWVVALLLLGPSAPWVHADIVIPARLDVTETTPGTFAITFNLPIVAGRVLRAEPLLPPFCLETTERERVATTSGLTTSWSVACEPASLAGEAILVDGLLGTQTDLAFTLRTLDGRLFNRILRPSRPGFLVPEPPSAMDLLATAGTAGARWTLRDLTLWMLLLAAVLSGSRTRETTAGIVAAAVGVLAGSWLAGRGWLDVSPPVREAFILLTVAVAAVRLAGAGNRWAGWVRPLWPVAMLIGALVGGASPDALTVDGLAHGEKLAALFLFAAGAAVGLALMAGVAIELRALLASIGDERWLGGATRSLGYGVGVLAVGMLLSRIVAIVAISKGFPLETVDLLLLSIALGPLLASASVARTWSVPLFAAVAAAALAPGLGRVAMPFEGFVVTTFLLGIGVALAVGRPIAARWAVPAGACAVAVCSWSAAHALAENVSRSTGAAVATTLVATAALLASVAVARRRPDPALTRGVRLLGVGIASWALFGRLTEYRSWYETVVATDASLGRLRIPLLALVLMVLAVAMWPKRRQVLERLGVARRRPRLHWVVLVLAFLLLPHGTLLVRRPFFEPRAPRGEDARRVASSVLSETYHAFNLTDESELYDRLADNVTADLVDDLYLDSRRRLRVGTREGAEVTVRDVSVLEIGEPADAFAKADTFSYDCRWAVTARVRHLQHIHHRQNVYSGVLTLTIDSGRWKIALVELNSEERTVVPWKPT